MRTLLFILSLMGWHFTVLAQDTYSIVAVDSATGQVGSAGASCLDNSQILGGVSIIVKVHPGRGAINTQSFWDPTNQNNASGLLLGGSSPTQVIDWLTLNDVTNEPLLRQYGIADFDPNNSPRADAFTGSNCFDFKGQRVGSNYAIQGNILSGPAILDSMEARFLNTPGPLSDKLMAALQGANVPGADTRCLNEGVSSRSAFLMVAKPTDPENNLWLDLRVNQTPFGEEPIDSLQNLYDAWQLTASTNELSAEALEVKVMTLPGSQSLQLSWETRGSANYRMAIFSLEGRQVIDTQVANGVFNIPENQLAAGAYTYRLLKDNLPVAQGKLILP